MQSAGDHEGSTTKYTHSRIFAILENKLKLKLTLRRPRAFTVLQGKVCKARSRRGSRDLSSATG